MTRLITTLQAAFLPSLRLLAVCFIFYTCTALGVLIQAAAGTLQHRFICRGRCTQCRQQKRIVIRTILVKFNTIALHVIEYHKGQG